MSSKGVKVPNGPAKALNHMLRSIKHRTNLSKHQLSLFILAFAIVGAIVLYLSFAAPNPNLPGDLNNDNTVNIQDLSILLSNYGSTTSAALAAADINGDGAVNVLDMSILLSNYGKVYNLPTGSFTGTYFNNTTLSAPAVLTRNDAYPLNFDWGNGSPDPSVNTDGFSARWDGNFSFSAGSYTFTSTVDDGMRLYIDNNLVMDHWINESATTYTYTQTMSSGTHEIRMEYYDFTNSAVAKLSWSTGSGGGSSTWVPAAPGSYNPSGTITMTKIDTGNSGYALFYPNRQHIVHNQNGIFVDYSYYSQEHVPEYWRLVRSTDNGQTWTRLYDSQTAGQPANDVTAPALETDQQGDVFVVVNQAAGGGWINGPDYLYKFTPGNNYSSPQVTTLPLPSAGKFSTVYDQTRNWIWMLIWELYGSNGTTLSAFDTNGNLVKQIRLWGVEGNTTGWDFPHYPSLTIAKDGTLFAGVTTTDQVLNGASNSGIQNYYDNEFVYSPDGGNTFYGRNGQISLPIDPVSETQTPMFVITDINNSSQFISHSASGYGTSQSTSDWNSMSGFVFNHGDLQTYYESAASQPTWHNSYTRFNFSTKQFDKRIEPFNTTTTVVCDGSGGDFIQDTTESSRLYFFSQACNGDYGKLIVLYSDDGGNTWQDYAKSSFSFNNGWLYPGAFRWVNSDGSIDGVVSNINSSGGVDVYYVRVQ